MVAELKEVVNRPRLRPYMQADPAVLLELIEADTELTPGKLVLTDVCRDPKDDQFIACARRSPDLFGKRLVLIRASATIGFG
jgi:predicted nucleic acid-binding protein